MKVIKKNNICIEVCLTSNYLTGASNCHDSHPVIDFIENDVPFVICTDNPGINKSSLNDEYMKLYSLTKSENILNNQLGLQKKYSFIRGISED